MTIAQQRLQNQRLVGIPFEEPAATVRWLGAVQAQDYHGAKWGLALRTRGVDSAALDRAFNAGEILRTHVMRPTWHFVAPEDLRWLLDLTSPRVHAVNAYMYRKLELDDEIFQRAHALFRAALAGGHALTRQELAAVLQAHGIAARGQRLAYIVMHAELDGLLCSGALRGKQHTYALLEERVLPVPAMGREEALATLARRYFTSHGPATVHDFAWWSGLTVADARAGLARVAGELEYLSVEGKPYWAARPVVRAQVAEPVVHLLPNYDEHVVAYRDHGPSLDPLARDVLPSRTYGPLDAHLIARNGVLVGGWRRTLHRTRVVVKLDLLVDLTAAEQAAIHQAAADYGRFIGLPIALEE